MGGQLRRAGNRLEGVVNAMKPSAVGPQRPIKDALECGVLDSKLKKAYEDAGYPPGQHLTRQQAENFLNQARASHPEMRSLYDPATTMSDATRGKGRNNWVQFVVRTSSPWRVLMNFMNRFLLAWLGSASLLVLYTLASQSWSGFSWQELSIIVMGALGVGLVSALLVASLIRTNAIAMLLTAQFMTILIVGWIWQR